MKKITENWQYLLLTGATATGKTNLAIKLAKKFNAIIVNCDSMQIYDALPIITTKPNTQNLQEVPHYLFSYVSPAIAYNVGSWLKDVKNLLEQNQKIIFVGGTGLYFKALLEGLAIIPEIDVDIRAYWRERLINENVEALYKILQRTDAKAANLIQETDGQRIIRALEVWHSTQKSISYWQTQKTTSIIAGAKLIKYIIALPKEDLQRNINMRVDKMLKEGALEEVEQFLKNKLDNNLPIMRAIGISEFAKYFKGEYSLPQTIDLIKIHTRQYAKRQLTWQRHQLEENWNIYEAI